MELHGAPWRAPHFLISHGRPQKVPTISQLAFRVFNFGKGRFENAQTMFLLPKLANWLYRNSIGIRLDFYWDSGITLGEDVLFGSMACF